MKSNGRADVSPLLKSAAIRAAVVARAEAIAAAARAGAPKDTGNFAASIRVTVDESGGVRKDRVVARVTANARYAAAVEFGNSHTPRGHFTLRRAAQIG